MLAHMNDLTCQVQAYLEIYDPLGMGDLAPLELLYRPVAWEVLERITELRSPEEAAVAVHRVLYLIYGSQAGHVRNYSDLGRDLFRLIHGP